MSSSKPGAPDTIVALEDFVNLLLNECLALRRQTAHLNKMFVLPKAGETISQYSEFRRVLWTGEHSQLVSMTIPVGGE